MGKYDPDDVDGEVMYEKEIPTYYMYACIAFIFNPLGGILAILFSYESSRCQKNGWKNARVYSDLSFALSMLSILSTILIVLMVYASGGFPDNSYFDREDVIRGYKTTSTAAPNVTTALM